MTDAQGGNVEKESPALELRRHDGPSHGSGNSTKRFYKVEFRNTSEMPKVIGDGREPFPFVIDNYWRALPISRAATPWGVNIPIRPWEWEAADHGLLSYVAAEAHRWAFLAALEAGVAGVGGALCIETRLVQVEFHKEYTIKEVGVSPAAKCEWAPRDITPRNPQQTGANQEGYGGVGQYAAAAGPEVNPAFRASNFKAKIF